MTTEAPTEAGYTLEGEIAREGSYALFRAVRTSAPVRVLVKRPVTPPGRPGDMAGLVREAAVLEEVRGEGILRSLGIEGKALLFEDPGVVPLRALLTEAKGVLDTERVLSIARSLAAALGCVHAAGYSHRAIRASEVLVSRDAPVGYLTGFRSATRLTETEPPGVRGSPIGPEVLSPEQTGRMNRSVDYRCDFYGLGAVLYELATGSRPFETSDPLALVHAHIARMPTPPHVLRPDLPRAFSDVVTKLLAKMAEDRYQSAESLLSDLEQIAARWATGDVTGSLAPGTRERSARFSVPQRLYGRSREVAALVDAFERAKSGPVFAFVSGNAGSGKTALAGELALEVVGGGARFLSGKFDQFERSAPYQALIHALAALASEGGEGAAGLAIALGQHAGVIASFVPELGPFLAVRERVASVGPAETENRLRTALHELLSVLGSSTCPLVLFLDDLQWADMATLRLLGGLLEKARFPVLFVGAFRPGDVGTDDPLPRFQAAIERAVPVVNVRLRPLGIPELTELLADTLGHAPTALAPLAALLADKTDGNPFFVLQFLRTLHSGGLLSWDGDRWRFDLDGIRNANVTDNVLDLMTGKLRRLAPVARDLVALAACVGGTFSLDLLSEVRGRPRHELGQELWDAMIEKLVVPTTADYELRLTPGAAEDGEITLRFSHDRIQQAAYAMLTEPERAAAHVAIGRALRRRAAPDGADLFDIAFHLNLGRNLVTDPAEREALARINQAAGRRARERAAIQSAASFFRAGLALVEPSGPRDLWGTLAVETAECEFVASEDASAEGRLEAVLAADVPAALKVEAARVRMVRYENVGRFPEALAVGIAALRALGIDVPESAEARSAALDRELARLDECLPGRDYASLAALPRMTEPSALLSTRLIAAVWPSAFLRNEAGLTGLLSATLVRLSMELGNAPESGFGYVTHAITVNSRTGRYAVGNALARVALELGEHGADPRLDVTVQHLYGSFLAPFGEPLAKARQRAETAHARALAHGDFTHAARAAFLGTWYAFFGGEPLAMFEERALSVTAFAKSVGHGVIEQAAVIVRQLARALRGATDAPLSLSDPEFDAATLDAAFEKIPIFRGLLAVARLLLCVHFDDTGGQAHAAAATSAFIGSSETLWQHVLDFHAGLALARSGERNPEDLAALDPIFARVARRREVCPANFAAHHLLLRAERERVLGRRSEALALYAESVAAADDSGVLPDRALARELFGAARMADDAEAGRESLSAASGLYEEWGALRKVRALEERYPGLRVEASDERNFDAESTLRAAQAIAAEIEWETLLSTLLGLVIENAGADRGVLFEVREGALSAVAEGSATDPVAHFTPGRSLRDFPEALVPFIEEVVATGVPAIVRDARSDERYRDHPHVRRRALRSVLGAPVVRNAKVAFVILLENALARDVFTTERVAVVRALAAQAAISLENARLYASMKAEIARRNEAETALRRALDDLEALKNRLEAENVYLQEEIRSAHNFEEIVGNAPKLVEALERVEKVAGTDSTVLVLGETGTGKELIARAVHSRSPRRERPLVKVNCGAIATGLVESELFGHVKGAFTGALARRVGRFELADGGTIFLDEVGELPLDTQTKLLRVLQEHEFEPVGSSKTIRVDVRVIAATNRNLDEAVRTGRFRADLLYRLNVFPVAVPPLRERREDIPLLVAFFVTRLAKKLGKPLRGFSQASMERLMAYPWPGNVRELENIVERASVFAAGPLLEAQFLPAPAAPTAPAKSGAAAARTLEEVERKHIRSMLDSTGWVVEGAQGAAAILGLHPNTLRSRMKKLGITRTAR